MDDLQICYEVCVNWIDMSNDMNQHGALVKSVLEFILSTLHFQSGSATVSFSRGLCSMELVHIILDHY
jgi:hypothetical protein